MSCTPIKPVITGYTVDADLVYTTPPSLTPNTIPTWAQVQSSAAAMVAYRQSFVNQTNITINWQIDKPDGLTQTYFELLGNYVEGFVFANGIMIGNVTNVSYDGSGNIETVYASWGISQTGYIRFY